MIDIKGLTVEDMLAMDAKAYRAAVDAEVKRRNAETAATDLSAEQKRWKYTQTLVKAQIAKYDKDHTDHLSDVLKEIGARFRKIEKFLDVLDRERSPSGARDNGRRGALGAVAASPGQRRAPETPGSAALSPARTRLRLKSWKVPA